MSEKAEATPGPWYWFTDVNTRAQDREVWSIRFLAGSDGQGFAHTVGLNPARDAANADMIAAARDMYEALKAVQKIIGQDGASMSEQTAVLRQMREALAKARGESHD